MLGWLRKKIVDTANDSNGKALQQFCDSIAGMNKDEISHLLVAANIQRKIADQSGNLSLTSYFDGAPVEDEASYPLKIGGLIKEMQKNKDFVSAGSMMVWLHSARAIASPPLRIHGKRLWSVLAGGQDIDEIHVALFYVSTRNANAWPDDFTSEDCLYMPVMLDPAL